MEQEDRRVRRTKKLLEEALIADIGYRTFFRHYADKDELLKEVLNTIMFELRELMAPPPLEFFADPNMDIAGLANGTALFLHVKENSDLYRVLLFSDRTFLQPSKAFAIQEFKANYESLLQTDIPFDIIANHMVSSMITLMRWWLENDMAQPPEVMGEYSFRLIIKPTRDLILQSLSK
jgi:AcrR family transcriptional regulator